jgi:Protein of unknown function (DUF2911)
MRIPFRRFLLAFVPLLGLSVPAFGADSITLPPSGDNPRSTVTQAVGPVKVTIDYSSPRVVRGPNDRKGKIWGELVPWGLSDLGANGCASCPWRAGANENTLFSVSNDVKVQGQPLAAGTYGLHMIPGQEEWTIIFSKDTTSWGSFWYDAKQDALRIKTKADKSDYHEWLSYEFTEREPEKATVALKWENLQVPFSISVENATQIWVDNLRRDLRGSAGFSWQTWQQAAAFCAQKKTNLPEALKWAERAVSDPTWAGGQENFVTLTTLSRLQGLNGREQDAAKTFDKAINHPTTTPLQIHFAARQLMTDGKKQDAIKLFQLNAKKYPNQWPVHVGLMRGYSAMGDKKKALEEAKLALAQAPDEGNRKNLQGLVKQLEEGKDIN